MRGGEGDPVTATRSLDPEGDREMGLASAWRTEEDDIVSFREEVQLRQVRDLEAAQQVRHS